MPKPTDPATKDFVLFFTAAVTYALNPTDISPREAFVSARSFLDEAERQIPGITKAIENA